MALGISTGGEGGNYAKVIKYDARAGRMFKVEREQDASGQYQTENVEITNGFSAVFDFDEIEVGHMRFAAGMAPDFAMSKMGEPRKARPSPDHKEGFRIKVKLAKSLGGDVRELASSSKAMLGAIDKLHDDFEKGKDANPGKLPVVTMTGTTPITTKGPQGTSTNYAPIFAIKSWTAKPPEFDGGDASEPIAAAPAPAAKPASKAVAPPPPVDDEEEFG